MSARVSLAAAALLAAAHTGSARAQTVDCAEAVTTVEMTFCAERDYRAADEDLNLAYGLAIAHADGLDDGYDAPVPARVLLRDAQRAWLSFRDAECGLQAARAQGGTIGPLYHLGCLERLTRNRTEDLRLFGETN